MLRLIKEPILLAFLIVSYNFALVQLSHMLDVRLYPSSLPEQLHLTFFGGVLPTTQAVQPQIPPRERRATPSDTRGMEIPLQREERRTPQRQTPPLTAIETNEGLRIGFDRGTNSVIIYGTPQEYESLKSFIEKIDVRRRQVLIAATVVEMSTRQALELGVRWQILGTQGGAAFGGASLQDVYNALLSGSFVMGALSRSGTSVTIGSTTLFFWCFCSHFWKGVVVLTLFLTQRC